MGFYAVLGYARIVSALLMKPRAKLHYNKTLFYIPLRSCKKLTTLNPDEPHPRPSHHLARAICHEAVSFSWFAVVPFCREQTL